MILLAVSLMALFVGPALMVLLSKNQGAFAALDALVVVAITGLVVLHIVPESVAFAGWPALVALVMGLALPALLHGAHDGCHAARPPGIFLALAMGALGLHALLDGVALVPIFAQEAPTLGSLASPLALGVVLHRLMEGVGVWWLTGSNTPTRVRILALTGVASMTVVGFFGGAWAAHHGALSPIACIQTMVAGSLLHVLMRHAPSEGLGPQAQSPSKWASGAGAIGGAAILIALQCAEDSHDHAHIHAGAQNHHGPDAVEYLDILGAGIASAVLVALALAALMHALVPKWHSAARTARPGLAAALGTVQGVLLAPCSCGVVPLFRRLLGRRAPEPQALAYLLAAPGLGVVTLAVSWAIMGPTLTLVRVGGAIVLSGGVARLAAPRAAHRPAVVTNPEPHSLEPACRHRGHRPASLLGRGMDGMAFAMGEVTDFTGPWLVFGLLVATLCGEGLDPAWLQALTATHLTVPVMALLALPLYLCGSASTLIAAVLISKGLSVGGALAFMWSASMISPAALSAIKKAFGNRVGLSVLASICAGVIGAGMLVDLSSTPGWALQPPLLALTCAALSPAAWALWLLLTWAILRQGVRQAVDQIALLNREGAPSHHHGVH